LQQFRIFSQIERRLGKKGERIPASLLPFDNLAQHNFDRLFVADQVVVDMNAISRPLLENCFSSRKDLLARLQPWSASEVTMMSQNSH